MTDEALRFAVGKPIELLDGAQTAEMLRRLQRALKQAEVPVEDLPRKNPGFGAEQLMH